MHQLNNNSEVSSTHPCKEIVGISHAILLLHVIFLFLLPLSTIALYLSGNIPGNSISWFLTWKRLYFCLGNAGDTVNVLERAKTAHNCMVFELCCADERIALLASVLQKVYIDKEWVTKEYPRRYKVGVWKNQCIIDALECWNLERSLDAEP